MYRLEITLRSVGTDSQIRCVLELKRKDLLHTEMAQVISMALTDAVSLLDMSVVSSPNGSDETAAPGRIQ